MNLTKTRSTFFFFISLFILMSISTKAEVESKYLPMFGGEDRTRNSDDMQFIYEATLTFNNRRDASEGYVERGFDLYSENKFDKSIARFNQAWLLNPNNPNVYLGFGLVLDKQNKPCQAASMFKTANEKGLEQSGFFADYAHINSVCALTKKQKEKEQLLSYSEQLYQKAIDTPNRRFQAYAYQNWAKTYVLQKKYLLANDKLMQAKQLGGIINNDLLENIQANLQDVN